MQTRPHDLVDMAVTAEWKIDIVERRGAPMAPPEVAGRFDRRRAGDDATLAVAP